jgi:putative flippase GtrA
MLFAALYGLLAAIATVANIGSQAITVAVYHGPYAIPLSVFVGTGVGLVLKYILDKRYIFRFKSAGLGHDGRLFMLYAVMGLVTTAIFWGAEYAFYAIFGTAQMRYVGGVVGLAVGYFSKYRLDKRFVFVTAPTGDLAESA